MHLFIKGLNTIKSKPREIALRFCNFKKQKNYLAFLLFLALSANLQNNVHDPDKRISVDYQEYCKAKIFGHNVSESAAENIFN